MAQPQYKYINPVTGREMTMDELFVASRMAMQVPQAAPMAVPPPPTGGLQPIYLPPNLYPGAYGAPSPYPVPQAPAATKPKRIVKPRDPSKPTGVQTYRELISKCAAAGINIADPAKPGRWLSAAALKAELAADVELKRLMAESKKTEGANKDS